MANGEWSMEIRGPGPPYTVFRALSHETGNENLYALRRGQRYEGRGTRGAGWGSQLAVIKTPAPTAAWNSHAYS